MEDKGIYALRDEITRMQDVPEGLTYDEIHEALTDRIPYLKRHECSPRIFEETGVDNLLDQLNAVLLIQCVELLEVEANG